MALFQHCKITSCCGRCLIVTIQHAGIVLWFLCSISHHGKELCGVWLYKHSREGCLVIPGRLGLRTRDKWKGPSVVFSNFISLKIVLRWVASLLSKQKIKDKA